MRQLSAGDVAGKLARIEQTDRSRRWKRKAKQKLIQDVGATVVPGTKNLDLPTGGRVCIKRRYTTFSRAFHALISTWQMTGTARHEKRVHPCKYCKGWHLTSRDQNHEEFENGDTKARPQSGCKDWKSERHGHSYAFGTRDFIQKCRAIRTRQP